METSEERGVCDDVSLLQPTVEEEEASTEPQHACSRRSTDDVVAILTTMDVAIY